MESFFHTLKTERVHHRVYATRDQARRDLFQYIEGSLTPVACTEPWAISAQSTLSVERLNAVQLFGGRSVAIMRKAGVNKIAVWRWQGALYGRRCRRPTARQDPVAGQASTAGGCGRPGRGPEAKQPARRDDTLDQTADGQQGQRGADLGAAYLKGPWLGSVTHPYLQVVQPPEVAAKVHDLALIRHQSASLVQ